jgi:hypothetical protein
MNRNTGFSNVVARVAVPAALAALTLLAGCATPAQRAVQMQAEVDEMIVVYGPACEKLGYQGNTDPWRSCILGLNEQKTRERYLTGVRTSTCWGHRGFYNCTMF